MDDFNPDAFIAQASAQQAAPMQSPEMPGMEGFDPDAFIEEAREQKYGTPGQMAITALEGAGQGLLGPIAPAIERGLGVDPEDIRAREDVNPITHGVAEIGTLGGSMLIPGLGQAAVMTKAGEAAAAVAGLGKLAETASYGAKVGSAVVKQAAEMAVLQAGDEASKMILKDPDASAQTAITNVGLAALIGGAGGGLMAGAVSPLWEATAGPQLEKFLTTIRSHVNGEGKLILPEALGAAEAELGVQLPGVMRAAMSGDERAGQLFNELREAQHPEVVKAIANLRKDTTEAVLKDLKVGPDDILNYSENQAGHDLIDTFKKEYAEKFAPIQKEYDLIKEKASGIKLMPEERLAEAGKILEKGQNFGAAGSPQHKIFTDYADRLISQETIGQTDKLLTEINNEMKKAYSASDMNTYAAFKEIKTSIQDFQENQLGKQVLDAGKTIESRATARQDYARIARISDEISQQMGLGEFRGYKQLLDRLADKKTPEQVLKSLSPKGNADLIKFMQEHFPATLERVRENDLKQFIRPSVLSAKGEEGINLKTLNNALEKLSAGKPEHVKFMLPESSARKIQAASMLQEGLPSFKSSGTAGWINKLNKYMPSSALAGVSLLIGHNPLVGALTGHAVELLGKNAPDAIKMGLLKFLASEQPIAGKGFKAMVEYVHAAQKGETLLNKAVVNVLKPGAQVLSESQMPSAKDLAKLDKLVADNDKNGNGFIDAQSQGYVGHYLPDSQASLTKSAAQALQYLNDIKPKPFKNSPLDKEIPPSEAEMARYKRALTIAQQPAIVLQRVKDGTLQRTDLEDLKSMYPALYQRMAQKLTNGMIDHVSEEEIIPYRTKVGMSLFLGQPLDSSMTPMAIMSAQPKLQQQEMRQPAAGPGKSMKSLGKSNKNYLTPSQASEAHKAEKD